jgi:hypothetical protein
MHVDHQTNNLLAGFTSSCALGARGGRHKQQGTTRVAAAAAAHMATLRGHDIRGARGHNDRSHRQRPEEDSAVRAGSPARRHAL